MADFAYASEKLWDAVRILAIARGPIKERLKEAAVNIAQASGVKHKMPPGLASEYEALWARLTSVEPSGNEGHVAATLEVMSEGDACGIAERVLDLAYKITDASRS